MQALKSTLKDYIIEEVDPISGTTSGVPLIHKEDLDSESCYTHLYLSSVYHENIEKLKEVLSNERKILEKQNSNNVLFLFLDNLSRVQFYRQYKKTKEFIKKFLKYQKFDGATLQNALPMFSGVYYDSRNIMVNIVKDFKKNGYITCNVQDTCHKELMSIDPLKN